MRNIVFVLMVFVSVQAKAEEFNYTDLVNFSEGKVHHLLIEGDSITVNHHQGYEWKKCNKAGFICYASHPLIITWPKTFDIVEWSYAGINFRATKAGNLTLLGERFNDLYIIKSSSKNLGSIFFVSQKCGMIAIQDKDKNAFLMVDRKCGIGFSPKPT